MHPSDLAKYTQPLGAIHLSNTASEIANVGVRFVALRSTIVVAIAAAAWIPAFAQSCSGPSSIEMRIKQRPTADAYLQLGSWFTEHRNPGCASSAFQNAVKLEPGSPRALDALARSEIAVRDYQSVIDMLVPVHKDERLFLDLGTAYDRSGQTPASVQTFLQALKMYPNSDALTNALATVYIHDSQFESAAKVSGDLADKKPNDLEAQRIYLHALVVAGHYDAAAPLGSKLISQSPHDEDLLQMNGYLELKSGDLDAARKHLEEAIALKPKDYQARATLGMVLDAEKDFDGARTQLEKAIDLGNTDPQVRSNLAKVLREMGKNEEAQQQLGVYQHQMKSSSDKYEAMMKTAEAGQAAKSGDNRKAADLLQEASALQPQDAALAYQAAMALAQLGDMAGERAALEKSVKADPGFALAHYQLGYLDFQAGNDPAAERHFRATSLALPDNAQVWCSLASVLARQSKFAEANDALDHALRIEPNNAIALKLRQMIAAAQAQR